MQRQGFFSALSQFLKKLLLTEVVVFSATGLVCWYFQWRTLASYSDGLLIAGLVVSGFGVMSLFGSNRLNGDVRYLYTQSVMPGSLHERTRQNMANLYDSMDFSVRAMMIGTVPLLVGFLLKFVG